MSSVDAGMVAHAPEGIVTKSSPFSVEETLGRLQDALQSRGFTIFAHVNHSGEAERVGLKMQKAHVLIFGNPRGGTPLMIAAPLLALELPLKVLVWQGSDEQVWVSYTGSEYLGKRYVVPEELVKNIAGAERVVEGVLQV